MPMTSPVERISGPSRVSASGKRVKGSTASLTLTWPPVTGGAGALRLAGRPGWRPAMTRAATLASGTPVALDTNGHGPAGPGVGLDHEDRRLRAACLTANCTLRGPITSRASAMSRV